MPRAHDSAIIILRIDSGSEGKPHNYEKIEGGLSELPGVVNVEINHLTGMIKISYDHEQLDVTKIREKLEKLQRPSE